MTFAELEQATQVFQLPERATLQEIRTRYRELSRRFHPDAGQEPDGEQMGRISAAYRVLTDYCAGYRFCFSRKEFLEQNPEERLREQFAEDAIWRGR